MDTTTRCGAARRSATVTRNRYSTCLLGHRAACVALAFVAGGCQARAVREPAPAPAGATAPPTSAPAARPDLRADSVAQERARYVAEVMQEIAGRERQPASEVFRNVKVLGQVPASRLLAIMNIGYGKSLGVSCTHCHIAGEWARDDKPQKQIAREMSVMVGRINNELLKPIPNLRGPNAIVNCTTCHRGQVKPALDLP